MMMMMMMMMIQVYPHGSTDTLPFATMGSGSLAAMAMFESRFKEGMTVSLCLFSCHKLFLNWTELALLEI
jgi:20S proteasome alpha/beta subunit